MFGRLYDSIDGMLGKPIDAGEEFEVEHYASVLLADLLDRCSVLHSLFLLGSVDGMNEKEIRMAFTIFKRDCDEARARGERLGLLSEPGDWTESAGERALMEVDESVTVHPYAHARWHERLKRQVARHPVPEWAKVKPTPKTEEDSPSPETGE